jgi:hypothetical protein
VFSIDQVLDALQVTREEFDVLYLQAQSHLPIAARQSFKAIGLEVDDGGAFQQALLYAQNQGWLDALVQAIILGGFENGNLAGMLVEKMPADDPFKAKLQALANFTKEPIYSPMLAKHIPRIMESTAKIMVDGNPMGTGVLISPDLVLTAWHVVKALFIDRGSRWELASPSAKNLSVMFNDFAMWLLGKPHVPELVQGTIAAYQVGVETIVLFSNCHRDELTNQIPANLQDLKGLWDYAIIKLQHSVERRWVPLDVHGLVPRPNDRLFLVQHPLGDTQMIDPGAVTPCDPSLNGIVPSVRFLHNCNTLEGSSGGPCYDKGFALIGIHQGTWPAAQSQPVRNRGIPIVRVAEHLKGMLGNLAILQPVDRPVYDLGPDNNYEPVIGCKSFQEAMWNMAIVGRRQVIKVTGRSGTGKTFRVRLLQTLLKDEIHLKISLKADQFAAGDAGNLAALICREAGAECDPLSYPEDTNSTSIVWLRDVVLPQIMSTLAARRNGRLVWIILMELNKFDIQKRIVSDLLLLLYQQVVEHKWLRIVLDGMKGEIPRDLEDKDLVESQTVRELQPDDVASCIRGILRSRDIDDIKAIAQLGVVQLIPSYQNLLVSDESNAAKSLSDGVRRFIRDYLAAVKAAG